MPKKLLAITTHLHEITSRPDSVTFYFDDNSKLTNDIEEYLKGTCFLYNKDGHNSQVFYDLGISDPHTLYKELGVYTNGGECPECRLEDLDKVFDYLLANYSAEPKKEESKKESGQPSEWDWILG